MSIRTRINYNDYVGSKFDRLTIKSYYKNNEGAYFICKCECGNEKKIRSYHVTSGATKSCGCLGKEQSILNLKKHWDNPHRLYKEKCTFCGKNEHYAKGYCRNCYARFLKKGTVEYRELLHKKNIPLSKEQISKALNIIYSTAPILVKGNMIGYDSLCRYKKGRIPRIKMIKRCFDYLGLDIFEELNIDNKYKNKKIYGIQ